MSIKESAKAIKSSARRLLDECSLKDPPLDIDTIYDHLELERYGQFFTENCNWKNQKLTHNIRAILDVNEKIVIVNYNAHEKQQHFASVHEVGHFILPWQKELLYFCSVWDLNEKTRKLFEQEANLFAAEALFYSELFTLESTDLPFGVHSIITLAERYNVSLESAARRYVEKSPISCALLVSDPVRNNAQSLLDPPSTKLLYYFKSETFTLSFQTPQIFPPGHVISKTCSKLGDISYGELNVAGIILNRESVFTKYKVLSLVSKKV